MKRVRLHAYWRSSCSWRARIALELKGVQYEVVPVHLLEGGGQQYAPGFEALNPMQQVPVLEWEDADGKIQVLGQSLAMVRYLDAVIPEPPLTPSDALQGARAWELAEVVNAGIQPLQNLKMLQRIDGLGGDRKAYGADVISRGLDAMERLATRLESTGFLFGEAPSVAEICLVPQLYNARRFGVDLGRYPRLVAADEACAALPAFQAAHPDAQPDALSPEPTTSPSQEKS